MLATLRGERSRAIRPWRDRRVRYAGLRAHRTSRRNVRRNAPQRERRLAVLRRLLRSLDRLPHECRGLTFEPSAHRHGQGSRHHRWPAPFTSSRRTPRRSVARLGMEGAAKPLPAALPPRTVSRAQVRPRDPRRTGYGVFNEPEPAPETRPHALDSGRVDLGPTP